MRAVKQKLPPLYPTEGALILIWSGLTFQEFVNAVSHLQEIIPFRHGRKAYRVPFACHNRNSCQIVNHVCRIISCTLYVYDRSSRVRPKGNFHGLGFLHGGRCRYGITVFLRECIPSLEHPFHLHRYCLSRLVTIQNLSNDAGSGSFRVDFSRCNIRKLRHKPCKFVFVRNIECYCQFAGRIAETVIVAHLSPRCGRACTATARRA